MEWLVAGLLFVAGTIAGTLNVVAGGGSFLTLPVLIFFGLPAGVANGTNRVGLLLQNAAASWSFRRHGVLDSRSLWWAAAPALVGGVFGAWLALVVADDVFQRILAFLMVVVSLWSLGSKPTVSDAAPPPSPARLAAVAGGFLVAGVYAGFVHAGVGFLILALTTAAGLDLVRGNAVKVFSMLGLSLLTLGMFAWQGRVDWEMGVALGLGNLAGGLLGARLTVLKGHAWIRRVVIAAVIFFAVKLWIDA